MKFFRHTALATVGSLAPAPVLAATDAELERQVRALIARVGQLEEQLEQEHAARAQQSQPLAEKVGELERKLELAEQERIETREANQKAIQVVSDGKSLGFRSNDGEFSFRVGGRLHVDAAWYDEDRQGLGNGTEIRRAFLQLDGTVYRDWVYRLQYDFARPGGSDSGSRGIRDAYIRYDGFAPAQLWVGSHKEWFGLDRLTSNTSTTFMERALTDVFSPDRHVGLSLTSAGARWSAAFGAFGEAPDGDVANEGDEGWDLNGRLTYAPLLEARRLIHLGVAGRHHEPEDSANALRFRARPESHVTGVRLVDTGVIAGVDDFQGYGFEAAAVWGPASIQGEYVATRVNRESGAGPDLDFDSWYLQSSWFLTGESRPYELAKGSAVFGRIKPSSVVGQGGRGAWELAARFSRLDLTDGDVIGGEQDNLTLGLNWYATQNLRLLVNYIRVLDLERPGHPADGDEPSIFQVRGQIDF